MEKERLEKIQEEFAKLDEVIASLRQLEAEVKVFLPKHKGKHGRKFMDKAEGEEVSPRMKHYWAARRMKLQQKAPPQI